ISSSQDPSAKLAHLRVSDEMDTIASKYLEIPNAPTQMYSASLDSEAIQRVIVTHASEKMIFLGITVKGASHDEMLLLPGRRFHQLHMGVILELKFSSSKHLSRHRRRRAITENRVMSGQCDEAQTSCCPHVQTFS
ncbi:hypothetical protein PENTCL1PPCAC_28082, partial [Pristionchus entomophagus]